MWAYKYTEIAYVYIPETVGCPAATKLPIKVLMVIDTFFTMIAFYSSTTGSKYLPVWVSLTGKHCSTLVTNGRFWKNNL